ncbi:MAG: hypothetical protein ACJ72L_05625 [Marmoricola sp.]
MAMRIALSAAVGAVLGFLCARVVLVDSGLALVPWALAGTAVGVLVGGRRSAALAGAAYGFALAYVFMLASYDGNAALATRLLPFGVFGVFGAACGAVLALVGAGVSRRSSRAGTAAPGSRSEAERER